MKQTKIRFNLTGMNELKEAMTSGYVARVGILGSHAARTDDSGLNNADIGLIQMVGSHTLKIPPRDFLLAPLQHSRRDFMKAVSGSTIKAAIASKDFKKVFAILGVKAEEFVQMAFETSGFGQWKENSPVTIAAKGSDRPLIDTGQLRRAISSDVVKKSSNQDAPKVSSS